MENKIYKAKVGLEFILPLTFLFGIVLTILIHEKAWVGAAFISLLVIFVIHMFLTTYYTLSENTLLIQCGFLYKLNIPIEEISKVTKTKIALSAPAPSMDRIEIHYRKYDSVLISPKNKVDFLKQLTRLNPKIILDQRLESGLSV
jgi:hypothetical protein